MQQLSTGLRINGAKDDAAGLAIASKMTSQIKGLDQAVRNSNDAISMLQTADGAMVAMGDMLQRMRELSVQGASDTNVASDRSALNSEFSQLSSEIARIAKNTQWNGMNVLDGTANGGTGSFNFQVGASAGQTVGQVIGNMGATASTGTAAVTTVGTPGTSAQVDTITIAGTYAAGDVITVNGRNNQQFQYTVATGSTSAAAIATGIFNGMNTAANGNATFAAANGVTVTNGTAGAVTITGPGTPSFPAITSPTTAVASGGLANVKDMNISTQANAAAAIAALDTSIAAVNSQRSGLGATINRLAYAADNLSNVSQNAQASRSRIQDTDYAKTSTELARTQIIAQAATAMLAQANQSQQSVLALLK
jgi:flagellin